MRNSIKRSVKSNIKVQITGGSEAVEFAVSNQSISRGALTLTGAAAHTFTASTGTINSIGTVTGLNAADWDISYSSNTVTCSPSGDGLANGPYSLTIPCYPEVAQGGTPVNVTFSCSTNAGVMSVISEAEANAALASATSNNNTVRFEDVSYSSIALSPVTKTSTTLTTATGAALPKLDLTSVSGVTINNAVFVNSTDTGADDSTLTDGTQDIIFINGGDIAIQNSDISCLPSLSKRRRFGGIRTTNSAAVTVDNNEIHHINDAAVLNNCGTNRCEVTNNDIHHIRVDAVTGRETYNWVKNNNTVHYFQGNLGRRLTFSTSNGTINVGDFIRVGSGPDNYSGGEVQATGAGFVDVFYNPWEQPQSGQTLTVVGGSAFIVVDAVTTDFDGAHGDGFQPLANGATQDIAVEAVNNFYYRDTPYVHGELDDEGLAQGILIQNAVSPRFFTPVNISGNVVASGMPNGIVCDTVKNGKANYNTVLTTEYSGADSPTRMRITDSENIIAHNNTADGAGNTIITSGNTGVELFGNVDVPKANFETEFSDPLGVPPFVLADFAPVSGQSVDTNDAGSLTIGGVFKTLLPLIYGITVTPTTGGAIIGYSTDTPNGTVYILMDQNPTRTPSQIAAGGGVNSDSAAISTVSSQVDFTLTGGTASTNYYYHIVHQDVDGVFSAVTEAEFTTAAASAPFSIIDTDTVFLNSGATSGSTGTIIPDGTDGQILFVCVAHEGSTSSPPSVTGVTFNGVGMTQVYNDISTNNFLRQAIYAIPLGTSSTSSTATISFSGALEAKGAAVSSFIASGLNQSTPSVSTTINAGNQTYPVNLDDTVNGDGVAFGFWSTGIFTSGGYGSEGAPTIDIIANNGDGTRSSSTCLTYREFDVVSPTSISQTVGLGASGTSTGSRDIINSVVIQKI